MNVKYINNCNSLCSFCRRYKVCTKGDNGTFGVIMISQINLVAGLPRYLLLDHAYK